MRAHQLPHFVMNSRDNMPGFVNPHKVVVRKRVFSVFQVHEMKMKKRKLFWFTLLLWLL